MRSIYLQISRFAAYIQSTAQVLSYPFEVENLPKKLVVGSANFGAKYGATNSQVSPADVFKIVQDISNRPNTFIESSASYQGAEKLIGEAIGTKKLENIIIKVSPKSFSDEKSFMNSVENSLQNLNQSSVYAIMLHGIGDSLSTSKSVIKAGIRKILHLKYSRKVGLSCYHIPEILEAKAAFPEMGIFQIPENIVDTRKCFSPTLRELSADGVIFQVRSVFLQGLLLEGEFTKNPRFEEIKILRKEIKTLAKNQNMNSAELCLRYALSIDWATQIVMGFENYEQYRSNLEILENKKSNISFEITKGSDFLVDPRNWS